MNFNPKFDSAKPADGNFLPSVTKSEPHVTGQPAKTLEPTRTAAPSPGPRDVRALITRLSVVGFITALASRATDPAEFPMEYMPGHQAADEKGYVKMPNVNMLVEMADMREANRSYEANLQTIKQARELISMTIDLLRTQS